ncbi:exosome complex component MTR3 [Histomonas meleagridis]|uniref:exosome complex component MTR3 n=1 Tax=Histomonas meleagridis TaxID=135588 RepID=UPI0035597850|nr:exosome complex component MTR3 [Histomonas meleagridis]KAH0801991.1 exosome complex component MTR3 [Histomonas meleagridis]
MTQLGLRIGDIKGAAGSSYVELNGTKVFAAVYGPIEPENQQDSSKTGIIDCVIEDAWDQNAPLEGLQHKFLHIFSSAICNDVYFKTLIRVSITIISRGGSIADATTLAGSLALLDAGIQMSDFVISCTVGLVNGNFVPFAPSETTIRVALLPSKDEIVETEVIGSIDSQFVVNAVNVAITGCKELMQSVRQFMNTQITKN